MAERVQRDVAPFHPSMITVMLGMNDGGYVPSTPQIQDAFQQGYRKLLAALTTAAPSAALTLILPTPYDEITHDTDFPGYSRILDQESETISSIAAYWQTDHPGNITVADFHAPLVSALTQAHASSPQLAPLLIPDRIHPAEPTHWIMPPLCSPSGTSIPSSAASRLTLAQAQSPRSKRQPSATSKPLSRPDVDAAG